jgi:hypothetical protein
MAQGEPVFLKEYRNSDVATLENGGTSELYDASLKNCFDEYKIILKRRPTLAGRIVLETMIFDTRTIAENDLIVGNIDD